MNLRDFARSGHAPTLFCAFLYFDVSFMVWVLLGGLATSINAELGLTEIERGVLVAVPLLGGACLRVVLGVMTDHFGARRTALAGLTATLLPLALGWLWASSFLDLLVVGLLLGVAGASFAAALPLASRWYPPRHQGLALGIAGAGNSGTVITLFFAPRLAEGWGWHTVFGLALVPIALTLALLAVLARESPQRPPAKALADYARVLTQRDTWWFCLFYSVTFGGFVGLASFLGGFFHDQYGLSGEEAGTFAAVCGLAGSLLRPVGGYLADRQGGMPVLLGLYGGVGACMLGLATSPPMAAATVLLVLIMGLLGMGNGAVFQVIPQRFAREIGVMTGVVGAAGGAGGFFLPISLRSANYLTGSFGIGFLLFGLLSLSCAGFVLWLARSWSAPTAAAPEQAVS
jgi:NNP family nitrate/nitrite transporter-like MFS transporter